MHRFTLRTSFNHLWCLLPLTSLGQLAAAQSSRILQNKCSYRSIGSETRNYDRQTDRQTNRRTHREVSLPIIILFNLIYVDPQIFTRNFHIMILYDKCKYCNMIIPSHNLELQPRKTQSIDIFFLATKSLKLLNGPSMSVGSPVIISQKGGKFHFHAPIGALVLFVDSLSINNLSMFLFLRQLTAVIVRYIS